MPVEGFLKARKGFFFQPSWRLSFVVVSEGRGTSICEAPALGSEEEVFSVTVMVSRAGLEVVVEAAESWGGGKRLKKFRSLGGSECARAMFWAVAMAVRCFDVGVA